MAGVALPRSVPRSGSHSAWRLSDRIGLAICWALGLAICAIAVGIALFLLVQGLRYLRPALLVTSPNANVGESASGGFLDPLIGTVLVSAIGMAIALPVGVGTAVWLSEYGRPAPLARAVESTIDMISAVPTIVLALFGFIVFSSPLLGFLSTTSGHVVYGRSFFAAGAILSLVALPLIVGSTRSGLRAIPAHVREASLAVGKTRFATARRILLPAARPSVVTGAMLGLGRIIGDTAIIVVLLGATLTLDPANGVPLLGTLRGTGSTLTSFVYQNAPTGDFNQPHKAYAAAFVLLLIVLGLNAVVEITTRRSERVLWSS